MKVLILCLIVSPSGAFADSLSSLVLVKPAPLSCYTEWFDWDDPGGSGDYETLSWLRSLYPGKICENPVAIEAQTISGIPASLTGQVFTSFNTLVGFICNNQQPNGAMCFDYKVRFQSVCPWP